MKANGWIARAHDATVEAVFSPIECPACGGIHLIAVSGKVVRSEAEKADFSSR